MSSNGFVVVLSPEGLERADVKTYSANWGVNENEQEIIIAKFFKGLQQELINIIAKQKALYHQLKPEEFKYICSQLSFGEKAITLEDIFEQIPELKHYKGIHPEEVREKSRKLIRQMEEARKQEIAAQNKIAALLASGHIKMAQVPFVVSRLRALLKEQKTMQDSIEQIFREFQENEEKEEASIPSYEKLSQLVDQYRKAPGFRVVDGKIEMINLDAKIAEALEDILKQIKKQEGITQASSKKKKQAVIDKVRRQYIRRGKEMKKASYSNITNYNLQVLINRLTDLVKTSNSSRSEDEVRAMVRTKVIDFIEEYLYSPTAKAAQGSYSFRFNENIGIHGNISEEFQATIATDVKNLEGQVVEIAAQVLGNETTRSIKKTTGRATATYTQEITFPSLELESPSLQGEEFDYWRISSSSPAQDKGDVIYQLRNLLNNINNKTSNMYIAFSDKFRYFNALKNQAIIGDDEKASSLLNSQDLFANTTNAHSILFALLNWHSVSYLSNSYKGVEKQIKQAINTQLLDFALNRKGLFSNIENAFSEEEGNLNDSNTLYVFRFGANTFIPVYQFLEGILVQINNADLFKEIVTTTISQSSLGTSQELYNQALSLHSDSQARWNYVAEQVAASIQIRTAIHFQQLLQIFTPKY